MLLRNETLLYGAFNTNLICIKAASCLLINFSSLLSYTEQLAGKFIHQFQGHQTFGFWFSVYFLHLEQYVLYVYLIYVLIYSLNVLSLLLSNQIYKILRLLNILYFSQLMF